MKKLPRKMGAQTVKLRRLQTLYTFFIAVGLLIMASSSYYLVDSEIEYASARSEYSQLRELRPVMIPERDVIPHIDYTGYFPGTNIADGQSMQDTHDDAAGSGAVSYLHPSPIHLEPEPPDPLAGLSGINPDFIGWIVIGDLIDYPVVRGRDNSHYLDTTFSGQRNASGAIFMDYSNDLGFDGTVTILYGHNMKDGSMFSSLHRYRDRAYIIENPLVKILTADGELLFYNIFDARITYVENRDADLGLSDGAAAAGPFRGAPSGSSRFLVLSTCTNSANNDERLRVYAALIE